MADMDLFVTEDIALEMLKNFVMGTRVAWRGEIKRTL